MRGNRNTTILFFTLVVVMLGFGMIIPIMPFYIESFGAGGSALGLLMATFAVMQFIFAPIWGNLSDRYGRKPILLVGVAGNAIAQLLFGLSSALWMLFAARALSGILSSATLPTAMAYIGDSTSEEDRGGGMGLMGAAMGVGMVLGPGLGGWLATSSLSLPFFVAAGLSVVAFGLIVAILPESLPPQERSRRELSSGGAQLSAMWRALSGPIGLLLFLSFLLSFGLTNFEGIFGLYALVRFEYGPQQVGTILTMIGFLSAVAQGALTGPLTRRWGELAIIRASLLGSAIGFALMLLAQDFVTVLATVAFFVLSNAMLRPAVSSLISKRTLQGQGTAMGLNNAFMSLGRIVGPTWAGFVFDIDIRYPYLTGAAIMALGHLITLVWRLEPQPRMGPLEAAEETPRAGD
ncbi:MAG: tetracycline resistance MFS efflux pump [Anaerolineae bacterium]